MNPYSSLPDRAFWRPAVAEKPMLEIGGLWDPKFAIAKDSAIATYGSCFAQHIGNALGKRGYNWNITERAPEGMSWASAREFNYGIFSSRTGNIYTTTLLRQWLSWAAGEKEPPAESWRKDDRFIDPFRPRIEPAGFRSEDELLASRRHAIACFRDSIVSSDILVFTLGLTESWRNGATGVEYPMCPGTVAGEYDPDVHAFHELGFQEIVDSLDASIAAMRQLNPTIRILLTVSPVPLTATNSGRHVLVATMHSKSILRAVAGHMERRDAGVDYFPSYEIISSPPFRGTFFQDNLRSVDPSGVEFVMSNFFSAIEGAGNAAPQAPSREQPSPVAPRAAGDGADDVHCEEEFLDAFSRKSAHG